jgi:hypothetical protein
VPLPVGTGRPPLGKKSIYFDHEFNSFNPSVAILEFWQRRLLKLTKYFGKYLRKPCPDG